MVCLNQMMFTITDDCVIKLIVAQNLSLKAIILPQNGGRQKCDFDELRHRGLQECAVEDIAEGVESADSALSCGFDDRAPIGGSSSTKR